MKETHKVLEAILNIEGENGLNLEQVKNLFDLQTTQEAKKLLMDFHKEYNELDHGLKVVNFNDVYKLATRESIKKYIVKFITVNKPQRLSNAAIEVAGIIAYKQPITRGQINKVRGAASDQVINTLLIKGVIEEVGISPTPGRPVLYGITNKFYDHFKISSLRDLPKMNDFNYIDGVENETNDFDLFSSQRETDN
ncbi:SMC-Scp complex subunit ScpB [Mycoplasmopsis felis]|uniref:SMC-Scp complex subunit ScpB n=1 Tax=Mycoplasmopsis felis TaxID=33923 RepID=UPI002AFFF86B|nr:SMC-Scp complex subunit ScpB [Mycoplasmopsis felis]WQQ10357.1 SMC-Scp complex subunit ScpB [Mycoplasmopsis felis]